MFSMRKELPGGRQWNRPFLKELGSDLLEAGFSDLTVKLPINLPRVLSDDQSSDEQEILTALRKGSLVLEEFLNRERNYPAIIFVAKNEAQKETIKILFGNISTETTFADSTFPSGNSVRSTLYVQSADPARAYALFKFFYEYLVRESNSMMFRIFLAPLYIVALAAEIISFLGGGQGLIQVAWGQSVLIDVALVLVLILLMYSFFKTPTGLFVNDRRTATPGSYFRRAISGDLRDNPIVNIILSVIASIITALILKWLGLP
jgi:hypothetical protein